MAKPTKELRAKFEIHRNDMFWKCNFFLDNNEWEPLKWRGYNDAYWWDNVSNDASVIIGKSGNKYKLHYDTLDVELIEEA